MKIDVYFYTDIKAVRQTEGTIYAASSGETPKGEKYIPYKKKITATRQGASVQALHDMIAGDEHHIDPRAGSQIIVHSTYFYITEMLREIERRRDDKDWKTGKGTDIAYKELWQEIACNLEGNRLEVVDESPDSEAIRRLLET